VLDLLLVLDRVVDRVAQSVHHVLIYHRLSMNILYYHRELIILHKVTHYMLIYDSLYLLTNNKCFKSHK